MRRILLMLGCGMFSAVALTAGLHAGGDDGNHQPRSIVRI